MELKCDTRNSDVRRQVDASMTDYALSTNELYDLALVNETLSKYFGGVYAVHKTPRNIENYPKAFIVNKDLENIGLECGLTTRCVSSFTAVKPCSPPPPDYYSKEIQHFVRRSFLQETPRALQEYVPRSCGTMHYIS